MNLKEKVASLEKENAELKERLKKYAVGNRVSFAGTRYKDGGNAKADLLMITHDDVQPLCRIHAEAYPDNDKTLTLVGDIVASVAGGLNKHFEIYEKDAQ